MALVDKSVLQQIIVDGNMEVLVREAEQFGEKLAVQQLTTSQIRNIFGTVRRIEMNWQSSSFDNEDLNEITKRQRQAQRELLLLKPRMAYQAKREEKKNKPNPVAELEKVLSGAIDLIQNKPERFQNFVDFFEAILAYHRANGGKNS